MACNRVPSWRLICILETLLLPSQRGFMTFEHAYELYSGYQEGLPDKEHFRDKLLNDQHGLPVLIFTIPSHGQRLVLLSGNGLDIAQFLHYVENPHVSAEQDDSSKHFHLCKESINKVLQSMDTEYDRECARALSANRSQTDLCELRIKPDTAVKAVEHVNYVIGEYENAQLAATDMLNLRLRERKGKLTKDIDSIKELITKNMGSWPK